MTMPRLRILDGKLAGQTFEIGEKPVTVGRLPRCDIHLPETTVSREHARLFERQGLIHVADLNSANGTFIDGERITRSELRPGSTLRIGGISACLEEIEASGRDPAADAPDRPRRAPGPRPAPESPPAEQALPGIDRRQRATGEGRTAAPARRPASRSGAPGEQSSRGGVLSHDLAQHGGAFRLLAYGLSVAGAAALFYLVYRLVRGA